MINKLACVEKNPTVQKCYKATNALKSKRLACLRLSHSTGFTRILSILILSFLLSLPTVSSFAEDKVINFNMTYKGYPPFMLLRKDGEEPSGIIHDVLQSILTKIGYSLNPVYVPKKRDIQSFESGVLDAQAIARE